MNKSLQPSSVTERITGNGATQAGLSAIAALSGGPLAALLPALATTLASERQKKRIEEALNAIDSQLLAHAIALRNMSDSQYKVINESVLCLLHTTCNDKVEFLRTVITNSLTQAQVELTSHEAVQLSRLIRDLSAQEAIFLINTFQYEAIYLLANSETADEVVRNPHYADILFLKINSKEGLLATSLASLGLLARCGHRIMDNGLLKYMPISAKLIALLKAPPN
jgi:hypothetical protein